MQLVTPQLGSAAIAAAALLRPSLPAAAAVATGRRHGHLERDQCTFPGFVCAQLNGGAQRSRSFIVQERPAHPLDRRRHRREVNHDFIRKTAAVDTTFLARDDDRVASEWPKGTTAHEL